MVAVRWYPRYGLSCRDVEELSAERGVEVDHVTVYRQVHVRSSDGMALPVDAAGHDGDQVGAAPAQGGAMQRRSGLLDGFVAAADVARRPPWLQVFVPSGVTAGSAYLRGMEPEAGRDRHYR